VDILLICILKEELSGLIVNHGRLMRTWGGVAKTAAAEELAAAIGGIFKRCKKYNNVGCGDVKKS
jgi:hypothetical protein